MLKTKTYKLRMNIKIKFLKSETNKLKNYS